MRGAATVEWTLPASRPDVFTWLQDVGNYASWMRDVRQVHVLDKRRSIWSMHGPTGPVDWEAEITIRRPHSAFAWCIRGPGVVGYARAQLRGEGERTQVKIERFLAGTGPHKDRITSWWGEPQARLQADMAHLQGRLEALQDLGAGRPNAIGFNFRASGL